MGVHLICGEFQSDKYPTTPRGKVPLSVQDKSAQDLLWEYAQRRREIDPEFSADLETALSLAGFLPPVGRVQWFPVVPQCTCGANAVTVGLCGTPQHTKDCALSQMRIENVSGVPT
jgi:hypothetical protein